MSVLQRLGERFWFVPAMLCLGAFVLAEVLVSVDERLDRLALPSWLGAVLYRVGESGSRDILGAIASSSLAVAGTTFSITIAVLALTSSTYGPRLVRNFMADRGNQTVLGVYVGTFLYSLLVLRSIRVPGDPGDQDAEVFVPHLAVNAAVLFAVANVVVLIYFIHHISDSIQVATLARRVRSELVDTVERLYPDQIGHDQSEVDAQLPAGFADGAAPVASARSGYLQYVADDDLLEVATRHDVVLAMQVRPGQYLVEGAAAVLVHPVERLDDEVRDEIRECLHIADSRTPHQDVEFAVQQLTEMAVRALSPGTNDPYTAINALDDLSTGLALLATRRMPSAARFDDDGALRIHAPRVELIDLVGEVLDSMRWYAAGAPAVLYATVELVERVGERSDRALVRARLAEHLELLRDAFAAEGHHPRDVERFGKRVDEAVANLAPV